MLLGGVLALGLIVLGMGIGLSLATANPVHAGNDRHEDYIICTGAVAIQPRAQTDGVWLLDYRGGKLMGTVIDRNNNGKIVGWAEVDLVSEFNIPPREDVHFMMTTGQIADGQSVLYVAETKSGKFAVYSMGPRQDNKPGVVIRRHDMVMFRSDGKEK
jgi:hypothetical protein